ncbi:hypothetical protein NDI45_22810 [Leptolyngbya sp. GB1-A1]|uniref:hypothetical protein n=1 Tax=Leptolyngbya sp. GB1-A1 TaxID=2933908 RepID=UPI00329816DC
MLAITQLGQAIQLEQEQFGTVWDKEGQLGTVAFLAVNKFRKNGGNLMKDSYFFRSRSVDNSDLLGQFETVWDKKGQLGTDFLGQFGTLFLPLDNAH